MVIEVSTSYPDGDKTTVKNCTKLYRKNPTHYSGSKRSHISEYYGEIFLHFSIRCSFRSNNLTPQRKHFFEIDAPFLL